MTASSSAAESRSRRERPRVRVLPTLQRLSCEHDQPIQHVRTRHTTV